jgi:integrase
MTLVKQGKSGIWSVVRRKGGKLVWTTTHTADKKMAEDIERVMLAKESGEKLDKFLSGLKDGQPQETKESESKKKTRRLLLTDVIITASKYRDISVDITRAFNRFKASIPANIKYVDELTADIAFDYLKSKYGEQSGKVWNNNKTYLTSILKAVLIDAGISENPFARVIQKKNIGKHQRPFTDDEVNLIIKNAKEPWKSACVIAYHTGLRQKDCFALCWTDIADGNITIKPAKTARHGRAVQIPMHSELIKYLSTLPKSPDGTILGFVGKQSHQGRFTRYFGALLDKLEIKDNEKGIVAFNSFRNTFVTRCDAAKIERHATRGIVGHTDDNTTDLYSHDITAAKAILDLPVCISQDALKK